MNLLDLTLPSPAENLACDEALLDGCESAGGDGLLRFWEPREYFVVVGYANRAAREVNLAACAAEAVPVLRRCSGGGTVLQGPGCLNYSLILKIEENAPSQSITSANRFIMERNRAALEALLESGRSRCKETQTLDAESEKVSGGESGRKAAITSAHFPTFPPAHLRTEGPPDTSIAAASVEIQGHTDLAIGGRKFSGNAQRRRKRFLLFHGTFLLQFDLGLVGRFLPMPSKSPEYRAGRVHGDFLMNLPAPAEAVKQALGQAWRADDRLEIVPHDTIASLARDKYATREWSLKF